MVGWLSDNWFDLAQTVGIIGTLLITIVALRQAGERETVSNYVTLTQAHRELWTLFVERSDLNRVLDPAADLNANPITPAERQFAIFLVLHLSMSFHLLRAGVLPKAEHLDMEIGVK